MNIDSLVSFDIFDTVLIRRCGKPDNIIVLLSLYLFPNDRAKQEAFIVWRRNCTGFTIEDFYSKANAISFLPYNYLELIDAELHIEEMQLVANLKVKKLIEEYRAKGNVIKFISDMYLPSDFLEFILRREGCFVDGDEVIVSCEWKARKENGSLFKMVRNTYNPKKWTHYGDNKNSDIRMAKRLGIKAIRVDCGYTEIEQNWIDQSFIHFDGWVISALAGVCRAARLITDCNATFRFAVDYIVPLYLPFVINVFENARQRGIKRLYFLSSNGFFLEHIAQYIPHDDLEIKFSFLSQKSLILPFLRITGVDGYMTIADNHTLIGKSVCELLDNIKLSVEDLKRHGIVLDFTSIDNHEQENIFLDSLFNNVSLLNEMRNRSDEEFSLIKEYFAQEGLLDGTPAAIVDLSRCGITRLMVNSLLKYFNANRVEFYYLSVCRNVLPPVYGDYIPFFKVGNLSNNNILLIDNFYSTSPWPTTFSFCRNDDGIIVPVFEKNSSYAESDVCKTIIDAMDLVVPQILEYYCSPSLCFFWAKNVVDAISECKYKEDLSPLIDSYKLNCKIVRKLSYFEVFQVLFTGKKITPAPYYSLYITLGHNTTSCMKWLFNLSSKIRESITGYLCR